MSEGGRGRASCFTSASGGAHHVCLRHIRTPSVYRRRKLMNNAIDNLDALQKGLLHRLQEVLRLLR